MEATNNTFCVIPAGKLTAATDLVLGLPMDGSGKGAIGGAMYRVPIRARAREPEGTAVEFAPGSTDVVANLKGHRRVLIQFPESHCYGIKEYEGDTRNVTLSFATYDSRTGPTAEQSAMLDRLDAAASWIKTQLHANHTIRTTLQLGPAKMSAEQQAMAADMMKLEIVRQLSGEDEGAKKRTRNAPDPEARVFARNCRVKLVLPDETNAPEALVTYFWAPNGNQLSFHQVRAFRNFSIIPYVDLDGLFASKSVRSLQLKLREAVVTPPAARPTQRYSVVFPERVCSREAAITGTDAAIAGVMPAEDDVTIDH